MVMMPMGGDWMRLIRQRVDNAGRARGLAATISHRQGRRRTWLVAWMLWLAFGVVPALAEPTVRQVAAELHVLVLLSDGTVVGWGENRSGQLAVDGVMSVTAPRRIALPGKAVSIAASTDASYAVLEDGAVMAWGRGYEGQLGTVIDEAKMLRVHTPQRIQGLSGVREVVARDTSALALLRDGRVMAWGGRKTTLYIDGEYRADAFEPAEIKGLPPVAELSFDGASAFARTVDGRVFAWGGNRSGQLGLGYASDRAVMPPVEVESLRGARSIAAGAAAAAVMPNGSVLTWGSNVQAGLGNGQRADTMDGPQLTPMPVKGVANAIAVKQGDFGRHTIVLLKTGAMVGWGSSDWGQIGAGASGMHQPAPVSVRLANVEDYWLGGNFSFARTRDGRLWFWGERLGARAILGKGGHQKIPVEFPLAKVLPREAEIR